jgi:hypothetical protein
LERRIKNKWRFAPVIVLSRPFRKRILPEWIA